jgi:hypothetical protein
MQGCLVIVAVDVVNVAGIRAVKRFAWNFEWPLFIFVGSRLTAATDFRHRRLWALKSHPTRSRLSGSNLSGPAIGDAFIIRLQPVYLDHSTLLGADAQT